MSSPMFLSLDWTSTQTYVVIHFGFNGGSLSTPRHLELSGFDIVFEVDISVSRHVGELCPDNQVIALLTIGVSRMDGRSESTV